MLRELPIHQPSGCSGAPVSDQHQPVLISFRALLLNSEQGVHRDAMLRCTVLAAVVATATAGARGAWQASLQSSKRDRPPPRSPIWDKSFRCVVNGKNASTPTPWCWPHLRGAEVFQVGLSHLRAESSTKKRGSRADVLALLALEEDKEHHRASWGRRPWPETLGCGIDLVPKLTDTYFIWVATAWKSKLYGA